MLWVNEKCTIEIGGWGHWGYDKEQVDETSSRLNVLAYKLQLKAKMCLQSANWWHYTFTCHELMKNVCLKLEFY